MPANIIPIVEGPGDVAATPLLIRRVAEQRNIFDVKVGRPIRMPRHKIVKPGELERAVELAARKGEGKCQILVLLDAEDDCPKELAPILLARAVATRPDIAIQVVLPNREFEAWFLGSLGSEQNPEAVRGAKERLAAVTDAKYSETVDQPSWASTFDMQRARQSCPSFDKFWRAIETLLGSEAEF